MEHTRHTQPASLSSQLPLDPRARQPLAHAAGNAQQLKQALALVSLHDDRKTIQLRMDMANSTVPSQPSRHSLANTLELRRYHTRKQKTFRFAHHPIQNSSQYRAYRERQQHEGNLEDQKWPDVLEDAFLNALLWIPKMGRRKYSFKSKPHGRNELIAEYLWLAYVQSLPHGQRPDKSMERTRKQVSSHIQVLKGFMKDHPDFERLFPRKPSLNNGFEESFKNDPCLRALSEGRIYNGHSINPIAESHASMRPVVFWLLITPELVPDDVCGRYTRKEDLYENSVVAHEYTMLGSQKRTDSLESLPNWREKFPHLERIYSRHELNCDIIHVDVSLQLMRGYARHGAELITHMEMSIPGMDFAKHQWQTFTTLVKPSELYHEDPNFDPPLQQKLFVAEVMNVNDHETRVKVPFPANAWAHAFTCLTDIQTAYEESRKVKGSTHSSRRPAQEYVDKISMYQEVHSSYAPGVHFQRRAILLWTFHKTRHGDESSAIWRYLDPPPPRRMCISPSPYPYHYITVAMNENSNSWADQPMYLQTQSQIDSFGQDLETPPTTAGLQSPFHGCGYDNNHFEMPQESPNFISNATILSEDTLVADGTTANIDSFLSQTNINLNDFSHNSNDSHIPQTESFDADLAWAYNVPASTSQLGWEDTKHWPKSLLAKQVYWIGNTNGKHDEQWHDATTGPTKQDHDYIETSIEQRLLPWIGHHSDVNGEAANSGFSEAHGAPMPDTVDSHEDGTSVTKEHNQRDEHAWNEDHGAIDYEQLAESLK